MPAHRNPERPWPPTKYLEYEHSVSTNTGPALVWTDAGWAYVKAMAADVNPHSLAIEWICTKLAAWFGLPVLDTCILRLGPSDTFPRRRARDANDQVPSCLPGPAFCTRLVTATRWDGTPDTLATIANTDDIATLVLFDTLIRNQDRYPPINSAGESKSAWRPNLGNVLLVRDPPRTKRLRLVAMDFGQALVGGGDLPNGAYGIDADRDELIYGLFPGFRKFVTSTLVDSALARLSKLSVEAIEAAATDIPGEWGVSGSAISALRDHLRSRAVYTVDSIKARLSPLCFPQGLLPGL